MLLCLNCLKVASTVIKLYDERKIKRMREPSTNIGWLTHAHTNAQVTQLTYHCPSNYSKDIHHAQLVPEIWKRFLMLLWKDPSTDHGLDVAICSSLQVSHKMIITFIVLGLANLGYIHYSFCITKYLHGLLIGKAHLLQDRSHRLYGSFLFSTSTLDLTTKFSTFSSH